MDMIEESDEDEDLGGYSSGTEGPSDVVHAHRINRRNDDNNDLDGPSPESVNEVADVDENTESSVIADRNVDRTLVWEEFRTRTSRNSQGRNIMAVRSGLRMGL